MIGMIMLACTNMMGVDVEKRTVVHVAETRFSSQKSENGDAYIIMPLVNTSAEGVYLPTRLSIENHKTCKFCGAKYILRCRNEECPAYKKRKEVKIIEL